MAKAIFNNTRSLNGNALPQEFEVKSASLSNSFLVHIQEFSPNLHIFRAKDYTHELLCEMTLKVKEILVSLNDEAEEEACLAKIVTCSFPSISLQKLNEKTGFNSYLHGILMFQFQLKILEQLLLFCEEKDAVHLILTINDADLNYLETYSRFFVSEERVTTSREEQMQVVIPTDVNTYDEIIDFMGKLDTDFRKILWREQNINPAFRKYLKSNACV